MKRVITILLLSLVFASPVAAKGWHLGVYDPGVHNAKNAVYWAWCGHRYVYCDAGHEAWRVVGCETGYTYSVWSTNGQYLGLFQMGDYARGTYGHGRDPWTQAKAAHQYWMDSGWSPWECKP